MNGECQMKLSKKMINALLIECYDEIFSCPICAHQMTFIERHKLVCTKQHSFDLAKQGYIHLAPQSHATKYDKNLFQARQNVMISPFFQPLLKKVQQVIEQSYSERSKLSMLDAGCGEGSHLNHLVEAIGERALGVGIDLAKEGIIEAAKSYPGHIWAVADLAKCPFQDEQFEVILNILSPANYSEFIRLLKPRGLFIKIIPGPYYLQELRQAFDKERENELNPVVRMKEYFTDVTIEKMTYTIPMEQSLLAELIKMTPLSWNVPKKQIDWALDGRIPHVTVDLIVLIGSK